jgi:hypothetical protein
MRVDFGLLIYGLFAFIFIDYNSIHVKLVLCLTIVNNILNTSKVSIVRLVL